MVSYCSESSHYSGVLSPSLIFSWTTIANIFAYFKINVLLVTAVHVKMKLGDNERLSLVNLKFSTKHL